MKVSKPKFAKHQVFKTFFDILKIIFLIFYILLCNCNLKENFKFQLRLSLFARNQTIYLKYEGSKVCRKNQRNCQTGKTLNKSYRKQMSKRGQIDIYTGRAFLVKMPTTAAVAAFVKVHVLLANDHK